MTARHLFKGGVCGVECLLVASLRTAYFRQCNFIGGVVGAHAYCLVDVFQGSVEIAQGIVTFRHRPVDTGIVIHVVVDDFLEIGDSSRIVVMCLGNDAADIVEHSLVRSLVYGITQGCYNGRIIFVAYFNQLAECLWSTVNADSHNQIIDSSGVVAEHLPYGAAAHIYVAIGRHH